MGRLQVPVYSLYVSCSYVPTFVHTYIPTRINWAFECKHEISSRRLYSSEISHKHELRNVLKTFVVKNCHGFRDADSRASLVHPRQQAVSDATVQKGEREREGSGVVSRYGRFNVPLPFISRHHCDQKNHPQRSG